MKHGTTSLTPIIELLQRAKNVRCHLALFKNEDPVPPWRAFRLFIDIAPNEDNAKDINYNYGRVAFACGNINGAAIVQWLQDNRSGNFGEYQFAVSDIRDPADWVRSSSHRRNVGLNRVPSYHAALPYTFYRLQFQENLFDKLKGVIDPEGSIIKIDCPTFPSYYTGLAYLMHGIGRRIGDEALPPEIVLRVVHTDAWIDQVVLGSSQIAVTIRGDQISGTRLAVAGSGHHFEDKLQSEITLLYPMLHRTSDRIWMILSRQEEWLDERDVDLRYGYDQLPWYNIKAAPNNVAEQVREWVAEGESSTMEYKREISKDERTMLKTIVAFANGQGGVILLGVDDDLTIYGVEHEFPHNSLDKYKNKITDLIHSQLNPFPEYLISNCVINSHTIVAIQVFEGREPPYTLRTNQASIVYVRRNATTYAATPAEIGGISLKSLPDKSGFRSLGNR